MGHGLANLPDRPKSYWETMANQLVDAQSPALAQELRNMAKLHAQHPNWPEDMLKRLGRLYLIIKALPNTSSYLPQPKLTYKRPLAGYPKTVNKQHPSPTIGSF